MIPRSSTARLRYDGRPKEEHDLKLGFIDYYLDDGLMGAPRYAKLHEATIDEVLDEMAIMGQYSI